ncbi:MAG: sugar nucleotide-binding protein [Bdellovibrio sp.]|nr:sugar nucleotide-binding protein [Bdellovibrio sp.]
MAQKRVLILGANGLLGTVLTKDLAASRKFEIFTHSHSTQADFGHDLSKYKSVCELLLSVKSDFCLNLLALTDVNLCESEKEKAHRLNVLPIQNIVKCVLKNNLELKLIQISTDHVYDQTLALETDVKIVNNYALSKFIGDEISQLMNAVVLRTNFFGASQSSKASFSDWIIQSLMADKDINGFGDVYFSPLHLSTLCAEIERVILNFQPGVYNLGSRSGLSKYEFIVELRKHKKISTGHVFETKYADANIPIPRPLDMRMDVSKFEKAFKTQLPTLLQEIYKC